jgi:hypothetical protein
VHTHLLHCNIYLYVRNILYSTHSMSRRCTNHVCAREAFGFLVPASYLRKERGAGDLATPRVRMAAKSAQGWLRGWLGSWRWWRLVCGR